ncbi:MAG: LytTR family DNA-binding domain-containing protein [Campylobacterota bacterium]|nr:LytTR family DNA-binding domain-containing protein [Campylobacterota bacterium]
MKILIVDDEKLASSRVKRILNEIGYEDITIFNDSKDALSNISKNRYDIVFLDIQMPNITGIELANIILQFEPKTFIIFQTAYEKFAIDAFKVGGVDYILKPTIKESIENSINKVKTYLQTTPNDSSKKIMGKRGNKIYLIEIDDIYYIKADLDEVIIRIKEADVYVRKKIGDMDKILSNDNFFRIHRSIIINIDKIISMQSGEQSKLQISFNGIDDIVTSSKDGAKDFREYLERRTI